MDLRNEFQEVYDEVVMPLKNYSGRTNTIPGMMNYAKIYGDVMMEWATKVNAIGDKYPDLKEEGLKLAHEFQNKLVKEFGPGKS